MNFTWECIKLELNRIRDYFDPVTNTYIISTGITALALGLETDMPGLDRIMTLNYSLWGLVGVGCGVLLSKEKY